MIDIIQKKELNKANKILKKINALSEEISKLSNDEILEESRKLREKVQVEEASLESVLPRAFALCREASWRTLGLRHFDVQMIGGIILNNGDIAEMRTGEGKTLVATATAYLNALTGKGVHIVTVNDYLAKRDSDQMSKLFAALGMTTGCVLQDMNPIERKQAYSCDITYGTNSEFGFDYLRDNMVTSVFEKVQRKLNYAIVDEVDSILIDEARTPLIISGAAKHDAKGYIKADTFAKSLQPYHYKVEAKDKQISLSDEGVKAAEQYYGIDNLSNIENMEICHFINQALHANYMMRDDVDYIVSNGKVLIVDEFTGRVMDGRRFSNGLHQAIEAKEGVKIQAESQTYATITLQNYFRMYPKLSGMTGTAKSEENEFREIYNMSVVTIPTNKPSKRIDHDDLVYVNEKAKWNAVCEKIKEIHEKGQPILVGTTSVEHSEYLSGKLKKLGIKHTVLNAKHHKEEAEIVAQAGRYGTVTVATNMAGRGTDIILGGNADMLCKRLEGDEETDEAFDARLSETREKCAREHETVVNLGGLYIIGTERHESRRIDNQLRGRAGRQGDPGETLFFTSLEDELLRRFNGDAMKKFAERLKWTDNEPMTSKSLTKAIEGTQRKVEGNNFAIRKDVLKYDDVMNVQRKIIYAERDKILNGENVDDILKQFINEESKAIVESVTSESKYPEEWDFERLQRLVSEHFSPLIEIDSPDKDEVKDIDKDSLYEMIAEGMNGVRESKKNDIGVDMLLHEETLIFLHVLDELWMGHLESMDQLKKGIGLQALGQKDPAVEYATAGYEMFENLLAEIRRQTVKYIFGINIINEDGENLPEEIIVGE